MGAQSIKQTGRSASRAACKSTRPRTHYQHQRPEECTLISVGRVKTPEDPDAEPGKHAALCRNCPWLVGSTYSYPAMSHSATCARGADQRPTGTAGTRVREALPRRRGSPPHPAQSQRAHRLDVGVSVQFNEPELEPSSRKPKSATGVLSPDVHFRDAVQLVGMAGIGAKQPECASRDTL